MTTRREFIQTVGATGAALAGLSACGGGGKGSSGGGGTTQPPIPIPSAPILVIVNIDGGYDWLNVMPPNAGTNLSVYQTKRATLGITDTSLLTDLGNGAALNNDFTGMDILNAQGRVAWIPGIGMPNPNLSHFTAQDLWGQGAATPAGTGWLGRFADAAFSPAGDVLRGLTVTSDLILMLKGASRSFVSIPSAGGYVFPAYLFSGTALPDAALLETGWGSALGAASPDAGYQAAAQAGKLFFDAQNNAAFGAGGSIAARTPTVPYPGDAAYPIKRADNGGNLTGSLSRQFKLIAQMIAAGLPAQIYFSRLGGWDTHSNQAVDHPNLQRALGGSIKAFYDDLATITTATGVAQDRVMILAYSEFGRRVQENNGGTDHGTAGLSFCVGKAVKGGMYGGYPDLSNLDGNGNMKFTTDFRSFYATVLDRWLGQPTATTNTLLGSNYARLAFL
ncbi:MAG: DUF1501 domain-containing protein [Geothrix sp.]|uniref:DUF1501 domain-containing protein n=1 Tax=Geothrix sp. TaxID=1962974 RepID=UPI0017FC4A4B|nr:DUF1501 domain-containing protein [Geothrix sp.]NWJ41171.1 DUF1501 domain-containing protein [Geothrix sp.]WIL20838.1 MAG: DUF1501 domain-containing protein [Geothrix sp.]